MARGPLITEMIWDPRGSVFDGHYSSKPYGGHDHLHLALSNPRIMLAALRYAQRLGLRIGENPFGGGGLPTSGHTEGSWHYQTFPGMPNLGRAADIGGSDAAQQRLWNWVLRRYGGSGLVSAAASGGGSGGRAPVAGGGSSPARALMALQPISIKPPQLDMTDPRSVFARFAPRSATMAASAATPSVAPNEDAELLAELRRQLLGAM